MFFSYLCWGSTGIAVCWLTHSLLVLAVDHTHTLSVISNSRISQVILLKLYGEIRPGSFVMNRDDKESINGGLMFLNSMWELV